MAQLVIESGERLKFLNNVFPSFVSAETPSGRMETEMDRERGGKRDVPGIVGRGSEIGLPLSTILASSTRLFFSYSKFSFGFLAQDYHQIRATVTELFT